MQLSQDATLPPPLKYRLGNPFRGAGVAHGVEMQNGHAKFDQLFALIDHPFNTGVFYFFIGFAAVDQVAQIFGHIDMERF